MNYGKYNPYESGDVEIISENEDLKIVKVLTKDAAFYTTTSRFVAWVGAFPQERQKLWLPKDDLRDSSLWTSPPLVLLPIPARGWRSPRGVGLAFIRSPQGCIKLHDS